MRCRGEKPSEHMPGDAAQKRITVVGGAHTGGAPPRGDGARGGETPTRAPPPPPGPPPQPLYQQTSWRIRDPVTLPADRSPGNQCPGQLRIAVKQSTA